jgi:hypothetical protein
VRRSLACISCLAVLPLFAQDPPLAKVALSKNIKAIAYPKRGSSEVGCQGTALMPRAKGKARVASKGALSEINAEIQDMQPAIVGDHQRGASAQLGGVDFGWLESSSARPADWSNLR